MDEELSAFHPTCYRIQALYPRKHVKPIQNRIVRKLNQVLHQQNHSHNQHNAFPNQFRQTLMDNLEFLANTIQNAYLRGNFLACKISSCRNSTSLFEPVELRQSLNLHLRIE